jgi:hypothetical protein
MLYSTPQDKMKWKFIGPPALKSVHISLYSSLDFIEVQEEPPALDKGDWMRNNAPEEPRSEKLVF